MTLVPFISVTKADCDREVFRSGGKGGQHQNKTSSGVRWRHRASGATGESRDSRSQDENQHIAWRRMAESPRFKIWLQEQYQVADGVDRKVKASLADPNIRIEVRRDGVWTEIREDELDASN